MPAELAASCPSIRMPIVGAAGGAARDHTPGKLPATKLPLPGLGGQVVVVCLVSLQFILDVVVGTGGVSAPLGSSLNRTAACPFRLRMLPRLVPRASPACGERIGYEPWQMLQVQ